MKAVEIFAGGGGLALGMRNAGFETIAAVELEPAAAATFKANHPTVHLFRDDVRNITGDMIRALGTEEISVLAACPPCQGFSSLTSKYKKTDERNQLVLEVGRLAEEIRPKAIMLENVPGLANKGSELFGKLIDKLEAIGYVCNVDILQVADYGVPQKRRRLVLLAGKGFKIEMPAPSHSRTGAGGLKKWITLREALPDFGPAVYFTETKPLGGPQAVNWHVVRRLSSENVKRLQHAKPGRPWSDFPEDIRVPCHRGDYSGFSNVYGRLSWDEPSTTITAGCTTLSKGRFGHPSEDRTLSLREAAVLQTFPSNYRFETEHFERACEIVGNALPVTFAQAVAQSVANALAARQS